MNNSIENSLNSQLELNFKVLIIGNYNIGKTSILTRYTKDEFSE
jgi:GTPase SAR1 family protein